MPKRLEGQQLHANASMYDLRFPGWATWFAARSITAACGRNLFTSDGLYVGTLLDGGSKLGPAALWGESQPYFYQAPDGTPYIINGGNQAEHVFRISGLERGSVGRFEGTYRLSADDVQKAAAMREVPAAKPPPRPVLAVTWLDKPPAIDGDLGDWNLAAGVAIDGGNGRSGRGGPGPRRPETLSGLPGSRAPSAAKRRRRLANPVRQRRLRRPDAGHRCPGRPEPPRRGAGRSAAVVQPLPRAGRWPCSIGRSSPAPRRRSPSPPIRIDRVTRLDAAQVAVRRDVGHGLYTVEAAVPLADLGIDPKSAASLRGDVGVIFADESGRSRSLRLYYYNRHTEMVSDVPTEATLQPAEWGPLVMPLGRNLLRNGGFEEPLVESRQEAEQGWFAVTAQNGSGAVLSGESPYSGRRSLLLETTAPITFPPKAYDAPDYDDFRRSANGGKGGGWVEVVQKVAVTGGPSLLAAVPLSLRGFPAGAEAARPSPRLRGVLRPDRLDMQAAESQFFGGRGLDL